MKLFLSVQYQTLGLSSWEFEIPSGINYHINGQVGHK